MLPIIIPVTTLNLYSFRIVYLLLSSFSFQRIRMDVGSSNTGDRTNAYFTTSWLLVNILQSIHGIFKIAHCTENAYKEFVVWLTEPGAPPRSHHDLRGRWTGGSRPRHRGEGAEESSLFLVPILLALAENKRHDIDIKSGGTQS
jgi:hypothetical protein